ncbi:poly(A) polymerase pla1 [Ophiocordyceps camponoti-floridani]|uniref:Poly(A) polymerase pla1 n=1 Tax=Ophiocordyceps camponoti-floridani TaxID=2030778 RepID=A0A8H4VFJ6_9HYPO|nr:poly(A) polymerase pla1 [Ophiocordyceps camponoti-floridani]
MGIGQAIVISSIRFMFSHIVLRALAVTQHSDTSSSSDVYNAHIPDKPPKRELQWIHHASSPPTTRPSVSSPPWNHPLWPALQRVRSLHDKAGARWPPHINVVYPFVPSAALPEAARTLLRLRLRPLAVNLNDVGSFVRRRAGDGIFFLRPDETAELSRMRISGLGGCREALMDKARSLTPFCFDVSCLCIMVRESSTGSGPGRMNLWARLHLGSGQEDSMLDYGLASEPQETFHHQKDVWLPMTHLSRHIEQLHRFVSASYNVHVEPDQDPSRYAALVANILSVNATADVLVLHDVTESFLLFLSGSSDICARYPYSTSGLVRASLQSGPFPSIVALSRFPFTWIRVHWDEAHSDMAVLEFHTLQVQRDESRKPLIVAAFSLTPGSDDEALVSRRYQLQRLLSHLTSKYPHHTLLIASHINTDTSQGEVGLQADSEIESLIREANLKDVWLLSRLGPGESSSLATGLTPASELREGEEGATFDPLTNTLAALTGHDNTRPRRYDRILTSGNLTLEPAAYNLFGRSIPLASPHGGVRCLFSLESDPDQSGSEAGMMPIHVCKAQQSIQAADGIRAVLANSGYLPTRTEEQQQWQAFTLLERVILTSTEAGYQATGAQISLIPVGSFGLGVSTSSSHVDCLCVASMSPAVFFTIATQRLRSASADGIAVLRRVKSPSEQCSSFKFKASASISGSALLPPSQQVMKRPSSDPAFALPPQTLAKLKPLLDLFYLRKSIPDMAAVRLAHLLIRAWSESRGLHGSRFGFLGGFQITSMLVPVCKSLAMESGIVRASDIVRTFFKHYANFNWGENMEGITWTTFLNPTAPPNRVSCGLSEFLSGYSTYIEIEARYWGSSFQKRTNLFRRLESRLPALLLGTERTLPIVGMRLWPDRLVLHQTASPDSQYSGEYTGYYLIGLYQREGSLSGQQLPGLSTSNSEALQARLFDFEATIRNASDQTCSHITTQEVEAQHIIPLTFQPDALPSRPSSSPDDETDSDSDSEEQALDTETINTLVNPHPPAPTRSRRHEQNPLGSKPRSQRPHRRLPRSLRRRAGEEP